MYTYFVILIFLRGNYIEISLMFLVYFEVNEDALVGSTWRWSLMDVAIWIGAFRFSLSVDPGKGTLQERCTKTYHAITLKMSIFYCQIEMPV